MKEHLYENIDELLGESDPSRKLGSTALENTIETSAVEVNSSDRYGIMAAKVGHFAAGLFPRLPSVA